MLTHQRYERKRTVGTSSKHSDFYRNMCDFMDEHLYEKSLLFLYFMSKHYKDTTQVLQIRETNQVSLFYLKVKHD